jgi:uncharacterized SAM-binding protein YcdF (DUF218 family)
MFIKKEKKKHYIIKLIIISTILAYIYGLINFVSELSNIKVNKNQKTDAIVILTGGKNRISTGLNLLERKLSNKVFISGVYKNVNINKIFKIEKVQTKGLKNKITLGYLAENTSQNARETINWAITENVKTIRLVTSIYHIPRSVLEFSYENKLIKIIAHPVYSENLKLKNWWKWKGTTYLLAREYFKYLLTKTKIYVSNLI